MLFLFFFSGVLWSGSRRCFETRYPWSDRGNGRKIIFLSPLMTIFMMALHCILFSYSFFIRALSYLVNRIMTSLNIFGRLITSVIRQRHPYITPYIMIQWPSLIPVAAVKQHSQAVGSEHTCGVVQRESAAHREERFLHKDGKAQTPSPRSQPPTNRAQPPLLYASCQGQKHRQCRGGQKQGNLRPREDTRPQDWLCSSDG